MFLLAIRNQHRVTQSYCSRAPRWLSIDGLTVSLSVSGTRCLRPYKSCPGTPRTGTVWTSAPTGIKRFATTSDNRSENARVRVHAVGGHGRGSELCFCSTASLSPHNHKAIGNQHWMRPNPDLERPSPSERVAAAHASVTCACVCVCVERSRLHTLF